MRKLIIAAAACLAATPALAHVVIAPGKAEAGSYFVGAFRVGHGCQGKATTKIRIEIDPYVRSAKPRPTPGWRHTVEMKDGRVSAITWTGRLRDAEFQAFEVMMKLPNEDMTLVFPTVQTCGKAQTRWTDLEPSSSTPAPRLVIVPAGAPEHAH